MARGGIFVRTIWLEPEYRPADGENGRVERVWEFQILENRWNYYA